MPDENKSTKPEYESWRRIVLENALDAVVAIDTSDKVIDWNTKAIEIFGYKREEALGKKLSSLIIPAQFREPHETGIRRFLDTGVGPILNRRIELEAVRKNGEIFLVELTVIPVKTDDDYLFYSFVRDISKQKLIEKDLRLKSDVLEFSLNGIDIVDVEGKFIYANPAYLRMWGYDNLSEILGTSPATHCADPETARKIINTLKDKGECDLEFKARRKDGSTFDVRMLARMAQDPTGKEIYPSTSFDISEQKKAREALAASEEQYHLTFDKAPVGIVNTGPKGEFLRVNEKFCEMLGYSREELSKLSFMDITYSDDRKKDAELVKQMYAQSLKIYDREKRYQKKDGSIFWVKVTAQMIHNKDGSPSHSIAIIQDISARKKAEEQKRILEEQITFLSEVTKDLLTEPLGFQKRLQKVVNAVVPNLADWCAVDLLDNEKKLYLAHVAHVDESKARLAYELREKYPPSTDRSVGAFRVIKTRQPELISNIPKDLLGSLTNNEDHLRILRSLGLKSIMCVPIEAHGEILGALTFVSEERNYGEADLKFAQELASRAALALYNSKLHDEVQNSVKARDEFISICSHELNTPLTSMKMIFQMAERMIGKNDQRVYQEDAIKKRVRTAVGQIERMRKLILEMLDVSRLTYGKFTVTSIRLDLNEVLKNTVEKFEEQFHFYNINYKLTTPEKAIYIKGDEFRLEQVFSNLITNAIKYGEHKPISISLTELPDQVLISVKDEGPGIEEKNLSKIFERFERAISSSEVSGLGLGLYISKEIIKAHGGSISVTSSIGKGSEFVIKLPLET